MKTVRKVLAFMLAVGLMVSAMSVFASGSYHYTTAPTGMWVVNDGTNYDKGGLFKPYIDPGNDGSHGSYAGNYAPTDAKDGDEWYDTTNGTSVGTWYWFDGLMTASGGLKSLMRTAITCMMRTVISCMMSTPADLHLRPASAAPTVNPTTARVL